MPTATQSFAMDCLDTLECQSSVPAGMGISTSRERHSLEEFIVLPPPVGDSGPVVPAPVTSLLPQMAEPADGDDEPTGVLGTLKEMPISEVVQTLAQGMKDAIVEVKPKGEPVGTIGMVKGRVVFAEVQLQDGVNLVGEAAFQRLFCAHRGAFRIRYNRVPQQQNIGKELTWLLLEAARVSDEERRTSPVFDTPAEGTPSLSAPAAIGALDAIAALDALAPMEPVERNIHLVNLDVEVTSVDKTVETAPVNLNAPPPTPPPLPKKGTSSLAPKEASSSSSSSSKKKREPLPRTITPFSRFFDEAGVKTPPPIPMPAETQRFQSLQLAEQLDDVDDMDRVDTDRTTPQRRRSERHPLTPSA